MQDRVDEPPIGRCPGCDQPMEAKERTSLKERLVDIRYVCAGCGMVTKRTVADETRLSCRFAEPRAASGHVAAPPSSDMNARRFIVAIIRSPRRRGRAQLVRHRSAYDDLTNLDLW